MEANVSQAKIQTTTFKKMHAGGAHTYIVIVLVRHDVLSSSLFFTSRLAPIRNSHTVRSNKNEIELTLSKRRQQKSS